MSIKQSKSDTVTQKSNSKEQLLAERHLINGLNRNLNLALLPQKVEFKTGAGINLDGLDRENRVMCEVYAHVGTLKGSQPDKVDSDILKMLYAEKVLGGHWRKLFCFADEKAAQTLRGRSWRADSVHRLNIEVQVVPLPKTVRDSIKAAQERQKMVNK